ncbi:MAG: hypothetical protein AB7P33_15135 [Dehalococcoidia bacterium]
MQQHIHSDELTADEAAALLGVDVKNLAGLLERYGVGRHYEARHGDEFVYDRREIEKVKADLGVSHDGGPT